MIILKKLSWSNCFSYGLDNSITFDSHSITQLIGKNGHGKSSIGLILEEILYNKNSKGIKKGDILNRYVKDKSYSIELEFEKDGSVYTIKTNRGTTQTVKFYKDGEDISSHTATNTFKAIEEVVGIDHKTFSQLIYQSSSSSLEFLVATDTNRKKFLIELLGLSKYTDFHELFKNLVKSAQEEVANIEGRITVVKGWLDRNSKISLDIKPLLDVPNSPSKEQEQITSLLVELKNIEATNKKIIDNNKYLELISKIPPTALVASLQEEPNVDTLKTEKAHLDKSIKDATSLIKKISGLKGQCPTCLQQVDTKFLESLVKEQEDIISSASTNITKIDTALKVAEKIKSDNNTIIRNKEDYEKYHVLIDNTLPEEILDKNTLTKQIDDLKNTITLVTKEIEKITSENNVAYAHNSKIATIKEQMSEMQQELAQHTKELKEINEHLSILSILQKTFSTNGLVAYKIECLVKDLEDLTNHYLADLSSGRFQISFKVVSDKLNVIITDNSKDIEILALSSGERARVNIATLLAIRKLMQSLSSARINLLILDETIENLDTEGKERLLEVLLQEEHLNTILVSHGFSHPLLEKLTVIKENNISYIER